MASAPPLVKLDPAAPTSCGRSTPIPPPSLARPRRTRGLVFEIVDALVADIHQGQLHAGDKLPTEVEFMARFGVSRTVVREAISKLQAAGLVETRHGIGSFVIGPPDARNFKIAPEDFATVADVIALLELRISLETEVAGLVAQRRTLAHMVQLELALKSFKDAIPLQSDGVPADFQFHMEVARATGNQNFANLMTYLGTLIIPRTRVKTLENVPEGRLDYLLKVHGEDESIYHAIRNQDSDLARAAMRTHLSNSRERLRRNPPPDAAKKLSWVHTACVYPLCHFV